MKFVFNAYAISMKRKESKGKVYCAIDVMQDDEVLQFACAPEILDKVQKFQQYTFVGAYTKGEYQGRVYSRIEVIGIKDKLSPSSSK